MNRQNKIINTYIENILPDEYIDITNIQNVVVVNKDELIAQL